MIVVIACDKFKGSLTQAEVIARVSAGIEAASPDAEIRPILVADGGDGTLEAAVGAGYERVPITVSGPTGEPVATAYARGDDAVIIEMADVCGLLRLPGGALRGMDSSSFGLGEAIAIALGDGRREIVVGIGGSASTDGGAGMLTALGARLLDADGQPVPPGAAGLARLASVDVSGLDERLASSTIVVACDVNNPLLGEHGAPAIFGPQKGVTDADIARADANLARLADLLGPALGRDERDTPGAGAAGGVGYALLMLGARFEPGIDVVLDLARADEAMAGADLVITGEGSLDAQSLLGKTPAGVARRAGAAEVAVVAVCGRSLLADGEAEALGIATVAKLSDIEPDPERSMRDAGPLLQRVVTELVADRLGG